MPDPNQFDEQNYKVILKKSGLPFIRRPEWSNVNFGKKYQADFTVLGERILITRPSGYATLEDTHHSFKLGYEVIGQCFGEDTSYIIIEDYTNLSGVSLDARKFFITDHKNRKNVLALIFCNTTALFNLSITLGKKVYFPFANIHLTKNLSQAITMAKNILSENNLFPAKESPHTRRQDNGTKITRKDEWKIDLGEYKMRFELINDDILHPVPSGFLKTEHIAPIFELQKKVFAQTDLKNGEYYLLSDLKVLKGSSFKARHLFEKALRKWNYEHPFPMLIFYNANWVIRAAINLAKVVAAYDVRIADNLSAAIALVAEDKSSRRQKNPDKISDTLNNPHNSIDQNQQYAEDIISILSGINWKQQTPEALTEKIQPSHPFRPVAEAISLIKMDMDQVLTEQKKTQKELIQSREKYKNILNSIEEGYYENDLAGNLTFFNDSLCQILGYSDAELMGINYREISDKNDIKVIYKTFNQVYKTGTPAKALDWKLIRKDGSARFIEMSVSCINDDHGNPSGFRGIVRDITQRVLAESEKEKLEARLRHAQKMEAIGTLAGGVAHDLNNILSGLVSYPDLLLLKLPSDSPLTKPIQTIKKSGEKAAAIVQDLLTLARRGLPDLSVVNLNTLINEYLKSPEHTALLMHHPLVKVSSELDNNLINISASSVHIAKIMMNLTTNAAEAMPNGGTIVIKTENCYIDSPLPGYKDIKEGDYIKLHVRDTGKGMSPEDQERIFEPFYTRKAMGRSGSGLGMAMVWGAVHDHKGYINISSIPGKESTISIYFPAVRSRIYTDKSRIPVEIPSGKNEKILVIDDLSEQRELAVQMLTQLGYTPWSVASGEDAVEYIKNNPADLLIIDMIMDPGMDGLDAYKKIIAIKPGQKAIIATGYSTSERIREAQSLGAGACLKKPYLIEDLARSVRDALDK